MLNCPSQSLDLNPIEHIWDVVKWEIQILDVQLTNLKELQDAMIISWNPNFKKVLPEYHQIHDKEN